VDDAVPPVAPLAPVPAPDPVATPERAAPPAADPTPTPAEPAPAPAPEPVVVAAPTPDPEPAVVDTPATTAKPTAAPVAAPAPARPATTSKPATPAPYTPATHSAKPSQTAAPAAKPSTSQPKQTAPAPKPAAPAPQPTKRTSTPATTTASAPAATPPPAATPAIPPVVPAPIAAAPLPQLATTPAPSLHAESATPFDTGTHLDLTQATLTAQGSVRRLDLPSAPKATVDVEGATASPALDPLALPAPMSQHQGDATASHHTNGAPPAPGPDSHLGTGVAQGAATGGAGGGGSTAPIVIGLLCAALAGMAQAARVLASAPARARSVSLVLLVERPG
jgi:hypothetical protein